MRVWLCLAFLVLVQAENKNSDLVTVLLDSRDFHVAHDGKFLSELSHDAVALLEIDEESVKHDIIAEHASTDEAKAHMASFLEETATAEPAVPLSLKPQYIFGTPFPPSLYHHMASDFPDYRPSAPKPSDRDIAENNVVHSNPYYLAMESQMQQQRQMMNPSTVQRSPLLDMVRSPALPFSMWNAYGHYGYPGPLLL